MGLSTHAPISLCRCQLTGISTTLRYEWWNSCSSKAQPPTKVQLPWRTVQRFLKKLKVELPYDPAIPLVGIYAEKTITQKDTCTPMFLAALFTIARTWKQPPCLTDEWLQKMWYRYTMESHSAIKWNKIRSFAERWMDLESVIQSEVNQKEKSKYRVLMHIRGI